MRSTGTVPARADVTTNRSLFAPALRRRAVAACAIATVALLAAACSGSSDPSTTSARKPSGKVGDLLTIGFPAAPPTLDPAKANGNSSIFFNELAYEPLIVLGRDGQYRPGLATSWNYVGSDNKTFVLNLRSGVTFSDGSPLTAQAVAGHFSYLQKAGGQTGALFAGDTISATGPLEVTIKTDTPNPDLVYDMTQDVMAGEVISPAGLQAPAALGTKTFGAGPYVLSTEQTATSAQYTYLPNPNYYDKSAQHYKKIVIKIIQSPQSTLQALQTGQIDLALGDQSTLAAAKKAGFSYPAATVTNNVTGVTLADRGGAIAKPLGDVRVRQALNDATDRTTIVNALFPGNTPTSQMSTPGRDGYDPSLVNAYPYDVAKAKDLLAQAGYANGFSLDLVTTTANNQNLFAQALAQQWKQIGVTVNIHEIANGNAYVGQALSGKFPAFTNNNNIKPLATLGTSLFLPQAAFNPFHYSDPTLQDLYNQDVLASGAAKAELDKKIMRYLVEQAWFVPVVDQGLPFYVSPKVAGADVKPPMAFVSLYELQPAE
jgi:peptide/nickel transport system substrate-binding protein